MTAEALPERRILPHRDRLSVLIALILLALVLTHLVDLPVWEPALQLPGFYLSLRVSAQNLILLLTAGMTVAGADWLFHDHPALHGRSTTPHGLLPTLTVFGVGIPLIQLPLGVAWWIGLFVGGAALALVFIGEYISIDIQDPRHPLAAAILIAASFALFVLLIAGLHALQLRLFFLVPAVFASAWLVSLRSLHLRLHGDWLIYESAILAFIVSQFAAGFTYWPVSSLRFSLLLVGATYALNSLMIGLIEERPLRTLVTEPILVMIVTVGITIWIG